MTEQEFHKARGDFYFARGNYFVALDEAETIKHKAEEVYDEAVLKYKDILEAVMGKAWDK